MSSLVLRDEVGQHGDAGARTSRGQQVCVLLVSTPIVADASSRLEPFRLLQHLIRWRVDEQRKPAQRLHPLTQSCFPPSSMLRRVQGCSGMRDAHRHQALLSRAGRLNRELGLAAGEIALARADEDL